MGFLNGFFYSKYFIQFHNTAVLLYFWSNKCRLLSKSFVFFFQAKTHYCRDFVKRPRPRPRVMLTSKLANKNVTTALLLTGIMKAKVFPEPVFAAPRTSLPCKAKPIVCLWISVGCLYWASWRPDGMIKSIIKIKKTYVNLLTCK